MYSAWMDFRKEQDNRLHRVPWEYIGHICDKNPVRHHHKVTPPFLSLYKIVPERGEIQRYMDFQRRTGFPANNRSAIAAGRAIETHSLEQARQNPGKLTKLSEITKQPLEASSGS